MRELKSHECQGKCDWTRSTSEPTLDGQPLFECQACHSEWVPSEGWTPRNADGEIAPEVQAARDVASGKGMATDPGKGGGGGSW